MRRFQFDRRRHILPTLLAAAASISIAACMRFGPTIAREVREEPAAPAGEAKHRDQQREWAVAEPPGAEVRGLDPALPAHSRFALRRLNEYRIAAGLPPYEYDPELTRMAQAHARYMALNCRPGDDNLAGGHFEHPHLPGYTPGGDEAARSSGLSFSPDDALDALQDLYEGPFHRLQFLAARDTRVGVGFARNEERGCGGALFFTRPPVSGSRSDSSASFVFDPPPGAREVPTSFARGEIPEPRPFKAGITGFPIVILLTREAERTFGDVSASVRDERGRQVPLWISDPRRPSVTEAPNIYAPGEARPDFTKNFGAIFLMPQKPLEPGTRYSVDARVRFGDEDRTFKWSFRTRERKIWQIRHGGELWHTFEFAGLHAQPGDRIRFGAGTFAIHGTRWIKSDVAIEGSGRERTRLVLRDPGTHGAFRVAESGDLTLAAFTADAREGPLAYIRPGGKLELFDVRVEDVGHRALLLGPGSRVRLERTSLLAPPGERVALLTVARGADDPLAAAVEMGPGCLLRGLRYSMRTQGVTLVRGGTKVWPVGPAADETRGVVDFEDALLLASDDEEIRLAPGSYRLPRIWLEGRTRIVGAGTGETGTLWISDFDESLATVSVGSGAEVWIEGVALEARAPFLYINDGASVTLRGVVVRGGNGRQITSIYVGGDASLSLEDSDLSEWQSETIVRGADGSRPGRIRLVGLSAALRERIRGGWITVSP